MKLYLARHGRSEGGGLFLGQSDPELSMEGRRQAERLAGRLSGARIESIFCSPLRRSVETADIVGERIGLQVNPDDRLKEIGYGRWDGRTWADIERLWPEEAKRKLADWWSVTPEGGEPRDAFHARVAACWEQIRAGSGPMLLVGHAGVNALIAELARGTGPDWTRMTRFEQDYGEVLRLEVT